MMSAIRPPVRLHYTSVGHGPDVLLVHGWASSSLMWSRLMHDLRDHVRFWAVDLYGFGHSPHPEGDEPVPVDLHKEMLVEFCRQHRLRPRAIIGHSMGGMLALKLAAEYPDLTERLALICPVVTGRFGRPVDLNRIVDNDWADFALAKSKPLWLLAQNVFMPLLAGPTHWYLNEEAAARIQGDFKRASWQASAYALQSIARQNTEPLLPRITQPALVVVGRYDTTVSPDEGRLAAARLPNARLLELPTHHQPLDEQPLVMQEALHSFLVGV